MRRTAIALAAVALVMSGCSDVLPDIDTAPAVAALAEIDAASSDVVVSLESCPIRDIDVLIDQAFALADDASSVDALESGAASALVRTAGRSPGVFCARSAEPALAVGIGVGRGDTSIDAHVDRLTESDAEPDVDVTERSDHRGGQVARVCLAYETKPSLDVCEVVWTDSNVFVVAFARSSSASDVDLGAVEERFLPIVQLVLEGIADE